MDRETKLRTQPNGLRDPFGKQPITQVSGDLYRVRVKKKSLLAWFSQKQDVTVTEDGRVIFPAWMLPAVRSLFTVSKKRRMEPAQQLDLFEERG